MGNKAYDVDLKRDVETGTDDIIKKIKGKYLCPSEKCKILKVPVHYCEKDDGGYFASYNKESHDSECDFPFSYEHKYVNKPIDGFDPVILGENLTTKSSKDYTPNFPTIRINNSSENSTKNEKMTTVSKFYRYCSSNKIGHSINNNFTVNDVCIDKRNVDYWYRNKENIYGKWHLIVGYVIYSNQYKPTLKIKIVHDKGLYLTLIINFQNLLDYDEFYRKIKIFKENKKDKSNPLLCAYCNLYKGFDDYLKKEIPCGDIINLKQIKFLSHL